MAGCIAYRVKEASSVTPCNYTLVANVLLSHTGGSRDLRKQCSDPFGHPPSTPMFGGDMNGRLA